MEYSSSGTRMEPATHAGWLLSGMDGKLAIKCAIVNLVVWSPSISTVHMHNAERLGVRLSIW